MTGMCCWIEVFTQALLLLLWAMVWSTAITKKFTFTFSWCFYSKRLTIAIYVRGRTPLEQL